MKTTHRLQRHLLTSAVLYGLLSIGAGNAAGLPAYAPVKQHLCADCKITVPSDMKPMRGVVISQGSFAATVGYWSAVDLDRRTMTRFITQLKSSTEKPQLVQSRSVPLSDDDLALIVPLMNAVWSLPDALPLERSTDAVWGLDLFDGAASRKEFGLGVIQAQGAELNDALDAIWRRLAR